MNINRMKLVSMINICDVLLIDSKEVEIQFRFEKVSCCRTCETSDSCNPANKMIYCFTNHYHNRLICFILSGNNRFHSSLFSIIYLKLPHFQSSILVKIKISLL